MKLSSQTGFILFSTLSLIIVLTLLVLGCMQQTLIFTKAFANYKNQQKMFHQLEDKAQELIQNSSLIEQQTCQVEGDDANEILNRTLQQGCVIYEKDINYKFLVESLGVFNCLRVQKESSLHQRLTLIMMIDSEPLYIQIRWVKPVLRTEVCSEIERAIHAGITSWRFGYLG